jgi:hypothetical protein
VIAANLFWQNAGSFISSKRARRQVRALARDGVGAALRRFGFAPVLIWNK